jgi:hypothetical protein
MSVHEFMSISSREITMNTTRAAAAFMLMINIIEEKKKPERKVRW